MWRLPSRPKDVSTGDIFRSHVDSTVDVNHKLCSQFSVACKKRKIITNDNINFNMLILTIPCVNEIMFNQK